jgi:hypothetical protein
MDLSPEILVPRLCGWSNRYRQSYFKDFLNEKVEKLPADRGEMQEALQNPVFSAQVFFGNYAFERAGSGRAGYGGIAAKLLHSGRNFANDAEFWKAFQVACDSNQPKPVGQNERLNKSVLQQGHRKHFGTSGSQGWLFVLGQAMADTHLVRPAFLELLAIHGIGPKIAAFLCRDLAWIFDCEKCLPAGERLLLQPVDTWIRQIAVLLWPSEFKPVEHRKVGQVDFLIADRIVFATQRLGQSGVAFNQGSWYFGNHQVGASRNLETELLRLQNESS